MNSLNDLHTLQLYEPDSQTVYTLEATSLLVDVPRRTIIIYYKHGLVSPVEDPACGGYYFNDEAIRLLRRIEYLRTVRGINLTGIRMVLDLMQEVNRLQSEVRTLRKGIRGAQRALNPDNLREQK
jgi:DNA-binding transcriptional MerR regulator